VHPFHWAGFVEHNNQKVYKILPEDGGLDGILHKKSNQFPPYFLMFRQSVKIANKNLNNTLQN